MNLNKFTKAELINKLQNIRKEKLEDSKNKDSNDNNMNDIITDKRKSFSYYKVFTSYISEILNLVSLIKELLFKLTLISFIIKLVRKYAIIRKIMRYIYSILFSVLGISFANNFGIMEIFMDI
jgi:hypothetical protein